MSTTTRTFRGLRRDIPGVYLTLDMTLNTEDLTEGLLIGKEVGWYNL